jgi:hypothetical protein
MSDNSAAKIEFRLLYSSNILYSTVTKGLRQQA